MRSRLVTAGPRQSRSPASSQKDWTTRYWAVSRTTEKEITFLLWISSHTACSSTDLKFTNMSSRILDIGPDKSLSFPSSLWAPEESVKVSKNAKTARYVITFHFALHSARVYFTVELSGWARDDWMVELSHWVESGQWPPVAEVTRRERRESDLSWHLVTQHGITKMWSRLGYSEKTRGKWKLCLGIRKVTIIWWFLMLISLPCSKWELAFGGVNVFCLQVSRWVWRSMSCVSVPRPGACSRLPLTTTVHRELGVPLCLADSAPASQHWVTIPFMDWTCGAVRSI